MFLSAVFAVAVLITLGNSFYVTLQLISAQETLGAARRSEQNIAKREVIDKKLPQTDDDVSHHDGEGEEKDFLARKSA